MLPRSQRLNGDQVRLVFTGTAKVFNTPFFTIRVKKQENLEKSRFSVVITKKIAKKAVDRNHTRRQIYMILRDISAAPGNYVISLKKMGSYSDFSKELQSFFVK